MEQELGFDRLSASISTRQRELQHVTDVLAGIAEATARKASTANILVILLGVLVTTRAVADDIAIFNGTAVLVVYAVIGGSIAVLGGIQAAFKFETRSAELRIMAASSQSARRQVDTQWQQQVVSGDAGERLSAATRLLEMQDSRLTEIHARAATLGVNMTLDVRELERPTSDEGPYLA